MISLQPPDDFGTRPTGFIRKFELGGTSKGPINRPLRVKLVNFSFKHICERGLIQGL